jgi:thioredoxin-like negative regulator of GroEL
VPRWPEIQRQAVSSRPRLVLFYDATDGKARRVEGYIAQTLQRRRNHETFVMSRVDIHERPDLAARLRVTVSPSLLVVDNNKVKGRLEKPKNAIEIQSLLAPWLR